MAPVIQNNMSHCGAMAAKKIKLDEPAISEIVVADTGSESGAEASDIEDEFYELEEQEASAQEDEPKLQQVVEEHQHGDRLKEGT